MSEKKIEDYLHLYLGCEFVGKYKDWKHENHPLILEPKYLDDGRFEYIKPILRPLSSMTEEEMTELFFLEWIQLQEMKGVYEVKFATDRARIHGIRFSMTKDGNHFASGTLSLSRFNAEQYKYLLSKHFDLFGLIDAGLAIDATKINQALPSPTLKPAAMKTVMERKNED